MTGIIEAPRFRIFASRTGLTHRIRDEREAHVPRHHHGHMVEAGFEGRALDDVTPRRLRCVNAVVVSCVRD